MFEWGRAICYSGYRENQSPVDCTYPTYEQIVEDLKILDSMGFKYIRMYDPVSYAEMTCQVIKDLGLDIKMMLGPGLISEVNNPGCPWLKTNYSDEELAGELLIAFADGYFKDNGLIPHGGIREQSWSSALGELNAQQEQMNIAKEGPEILRI